MAASVCCVLGQPIAQDSSIHAVKALQDHLVDTLGAEPLDRWTVEVNYKLKQQKKKTMGSEMKFGVNVAAPFAGMKRDKSSAYPYAKQFWVRRSELAARIYVVQEMAKDAEAPKQQKIGTSEPKSSLGEEEAVGRERLEKGKLMHVVEGGNELATTLGSQPALAARLKAVIDGQVYGLGDFLVRVGSCRKGAVYKGLALEVEYMPSCRITDGLSMIEAFLPNIDESGRFIPASDLRNTAVFGSNPMYSGKHTALQTVELFSQVFS